MVIAYDRSAPAPLQTTRLETLGGKQHVADRRRESVVLGWPLPRGSRPVTLDEIKERLASASNSITIDRQSEALTIRHGPAPTISDDIRRDIATPADTRRSSWSGL